MSNAIRGCTSCAAHQLREGVGGAAVLGEEVVVLVLVGVLGATHEQHVLQVVGQPLLARSGSG